MTKRYWLVVGDGVAVIVVAASAGRALGRATQWFDPRHVVEIPGSRFWKVDHVQRAA